MGTTILIIIGVIVILYFIGRSKKSANNYQDSTKKLKKEETAKATVSLKNRPLPKTDRSSILIPKNEEILDLPQEVRGINLNLLVQIDYVDSMGNESTRPITIKQASLSINNEYYLKAYCHEKKAMRTFKLSRIENMVDIETGEAIEDIGNYFLERFNDSPVGIITKVLQDLEPQLLILVYMARADGYLRKKERKIIVDFIANKSEKDINQNLADNEIRKTYCEISDLRRMLKIMKSQPKKEKELLIEAIDRIIHTDKDIDPLEQGAFELILKKIE